MQCERCSRPVSTRFFFPVANPLRRMLNSLKQNMTDGKWICEECLKQSKQSGVTACHALTRRQKEIQKPQNVGRRVAGTPRNPIMRGLNENE